MVRANDAEVVWDAQKKNWIVRIRAGEEVVRRPCKKATHEMADEELRSLAVQTAHDDGYELGPESVRVTR
jgi:hypothetical protein